MSVYELSIDPDLVAKAEQIASLEGCTYPTLAMRWESTIFNQPWTTTVVLDYALSFPPLMIGQATFNDVRIAALTEGAPTKFLYLGTEMTGSVERVGPEMENVMGPSERWQEYRLDEESCPIPYLKLITATPRIFGDGPQDYYSPPIRVERYDAMPTPDLLADMFAANVAALPHTTGPTLVSDDEGMWQGSRYVGITRIAILRQGQVVGLHLRAARPEKDQAPPDVKRRDPRRDFRTNWVAIDVGARTSVVATKNRTGGTEFFRIGSTDPISLPVDWESPTEVHFGHLGKVLKSWRERVIQPYTRWGEVLVGVAARARRSGSETAKARTAASATELPLMRRRIEAKDQIALRGELDADTRETLKKPAPPVIDEDGIGAYDPFDPFEVYAYYLGLTLNHRSRGIHTRYAVSMPTAWPRELRESVLVSLRRGLFRSMPAGAVEYHDLAALEVVDLAPSSVALLVHGTRAFNIQTRGEPVLVGCVDVGATHAGIVLGHLRPARPDERDLGHAVVIEHLEPMSVPTFGGEHILQRLAENVWSSHEAVMLEHRVPLDVRVSGVSLAGAPELVSTSAEARANALLLRDALRPFLEATASAKSPTSLSLYDEHGGMRELPLTLDDAALRADVEALLLEGARAVFELIDEGISKIGKDPTPYEGLRLVLGGRVGLHPTLQDALRKLVPEAAMIHRYREPDKTNLGAPTVKTAVTLGLLAMKNDKIGATLRSETRTPFRYRVGRARHGQLSDALTPTSEYDFWYEIGAQTKPSLEVLYMRAEDDGEVAADDPRVERVLCELGDAAVGQRLYFRAVGPLRVELSVGPPGEAPQSDAPKLAIDLRTGVVETLQA
jgi:hypothetical protein